MSRILEKIHHVLIRLCFRPIRIFVFHHVSDMHDPLICAIEDWTQMDQFKRNILSLQKQYRFISLTRALKKLKYDWFRFGNYAVLTTDDGLSSVLELLPWLEERKIPLTMFVNSRYMECDVLKTVHLERLKEIAPDADIKNIAEKMYLSKDQVFALNSSFIEIGMHGHDHLNAQRITEGKFEEDFEVGKKILQSHPRYIKAYAYPWGKHTIESTTYMDKLGIVALAVKGGKNYVWKPCLNRECIDNISL